MGKKIVLGTIDDMIADFLWYDRKEDEELPRGKIEKMVSSGELTVDEIVARFKEKLLEGLK